MMRPLLALLVFGLSTSAQAHSWLPDDCCHGRDCYPVKYDAGEVKIVPGGYYIRPDNFTMPFTDARVRHGNPTNDFYICRNWKVKTNPPKCLFPPESMF